MNISSHLHPTVHQRLPTTTVSRFRFGVGDHDLRLCPGIQGIQGIQSSPLEELGIEWRGNKSPCFAPMTGNGLNRFKQVYSSKHGHEEKNMGCT